MANVSVVLDGPKKVQAGESVTGHVIVEVEDENIRTPSSLELQFRGDEKTEVIWHEKIGHGRRAKTERRLAHSHRSLVSQKQTLGVGFKDADESGVHKFPFEVQVPEALPGTMLSVHEGGWCEIAYELHAKLTCVHQMDYIARKSIVLVAKPADNLLAAPNSAPPTVQDVTTCGVINRGKLLLGAEVGDTQLSPGSECSVRVALRNYSNLKPKDIRFRLVQNVTWKAHGYSATQSSKTQKKLVTVGSPSILQRFRRQGKQDKKLSSSADLKQDLKGVSSEKESESGPSASLMLPSSLMDSYRGALIQVAHRVEVKVKTRLLQNNPTISIPISVGQPSHSTDAQQDIENKKSEQELQNKKSDEKLVKDTAKKPATAKNPVKRVRSSAMNR